MRLLREQQFNKTSSQPEAQYYQMYVFLRSLTYNLFTY